MSREGLEEKKIERRVRRYEEERLVRLKRSEEFETIEEVFDKFTLETLYELMRRGIIDEMQGVVKAGKEARIYGGRSPGGREFAIKIYYTVTADFKQGMLKYIQDDYRFKRIDRSRRGIIYVWAQKEFRNLREAYRVGVTVPEPIEVLKNVLVMEFLGENGEPAPLLRNVSLDKPKPIYRKLLDEVKLLYTKAEIIHGDLSEYNIMFWKEKCYIIDISQAVPTNHPMAAELLERDIGNLNRYFAHLDVKTFDAERIREWIVSGNKGLR